MAFYMNAKGRFNMNENNNNSSTKKGLVEIILEESVRAFFSIGLPLLVNCFISAKQKNKKES
jgi:hypothetical protein